MSPLFLVLELEVALFNFGVTFENLNRDVDIVQITQVLDERNDEARILTDVVNHLMLTRFNPE